MTHHPRTTLNHFFDTSLTPGQQAAVDALQQFLADPAERCFALKGYAGTGKTFLMSGLVKYLAARNQYFVLMAPTGRAAKVLTQKTGSQAATIHRSIYALEALKEAAPKNDAGKGDFKFYYSLRPNANPAGTVYIIDEASMISDIYNETEFFRFGSGRLLQDLFQYIGFSPGLPHKLIFVGDTAQLPPVNSAVSPALSGEYLQNAFKITPQEYQLTEVVRQTSQSGILRNATKLREAVQRDIYNRFELETTWPDIRAIKPDNILPRYLEAAGNKISGTTIIVAYSNRIVSDYNRLVRNHFFPNQTQICAGDKILLTQNNYAYQIELFNGDFGKVIKAATQPETRRISVGSKHITLAFRDVVIRFWDITNRPHDIGCKIIENLLTSKERELSPEETKALYIDFKIRHGGLLPNTKAFKDALRTDRYFNALRIKYGYAVTCHKAQGGEWPRVFVDFDAPMGKLNQTYFRWAYTAITRAEKQLYLLNTPQLGLASQLTGSAITTPEQQDKPVLIEQFPEAACQFEFPEDKPFLKTIYGAVKQSLRGQAISIDRLEHLQYCERYFFSLEDQSLWVNIWYNRHDRISRIYSQPNIAGTLLDTLLPLLTPLKNKSLIISAPLVSPRPVSGPKIDFPPDKPYLREFFDTLSAKLSTENIFISQVTHHNYLEKYVFKQGEFTACIDFYYNGKGQFSKLIPVPQKSTSIELLNQIIKLSTGPTDDNHY